MLKSSNKWHKPAPVSSARITELSVYISEQAGPLEGILYRGRCELSSRVTRVVSYYSLSR